VGSLAGKPIERRNCLKSGYYMLLTIATSDVHDHRCDREISTVPFFPANLGSEAGELPRTLAVSQDSRYSLPFKETWSQVAIVNSAQRFSSCSYRENGLKIPVGADNFIPHHN
jgi:hypothetical protein